MYLRTVSGRFVRCGLIPSKSEPALRGCWVGDWLGLGRQPAGFFIFSEYLQNQDLR